MINVEKIRRPPLYLSYVCLLIKEQTKLINSQIERMIKGGYRCNFADTATEKYKGKNKSIGFGSSFYSSLLAELGSFSMFRITFFLNPSVAPFVAATSKNER